MDYIGTESLLPNLISEKAIKDIGNFYQIPDTDTGVQDVIHGMSYFYNQYVQPNLFPLLVILFLIIYLMIKYIIKQEKEENINNKNNKGDKGDKSDKNGRSEKNDDKKEKKSKKVILEDRVEKKRISDMISDEYLLDDLE